MERAYEKSLGTALVAVGVAVLLFGFVLAYEDLRSVPSGRAPTAKFDWTVNGYSATFTDTSTANGASIVTVYWTFGDGSSNSSPSTSHTYGAPGGQVNVTLEVQDANGVSAQSTATFSVPSSGTQSGSSSASGPVGNQSNLGSVLGPALGGLSGLVSTAESFVYLLVILVAGGSILRAGWNLITPKAETISVRVKPRSLQVEPVSPPAPPSAATPSAPPPPSPP